MKRSLKKLSIKNQKIQYSNLFLKSNQFHHNLNLTSKKPLISCKAPQIQRKQYFYTSKEKNFDQKIKGPILGYESIMSEKGNGTCSKKPLPSLRYNISQNLANHICCFNRHYAEPSLSFLRPPTSWKSEISEKILKKKETKSIDYYDSIYGKHIFTSPLNRSFENFLEESENHGWPSFRDEEVNWEVVRVLPNGETITIDGVHLGHNLPDYKGNRYCINLCCIAGYPPNEK